MVHVQKPSAGNFDYAAYLADFNGNDDVAMITRWYTEDCMIERHPMTTLVGRDAWIADNILLHDGVTETLTLHSWLQEGNAVAAELTTCFRADEDRPDHPVGCLMKGQSRSVRIFAFYTIRAGQICSLRLAIWPPSEIVDA